MEFKRYSNEFAFKDAYLLLTTLMASGQELIVNPVKKMLSLIIAKQMEMNSHENYDIGIKFQTYNVIITVSGQFESKDSIPEAFRKNAIGYERSNGYYGYYRYNNKQWRVSEIFKNVENITQLERDAILKDIPENANGITYNSQVITTTNWDLILASILDGSLDLISFGTSFVTKEVPYHYSQHKNDRFHPPPDVSQFMTKDREASLMKYCHLLNITYTPKHTILSVNTLITSLENKLDLANPVYIVDRKRNKKGRTGSDKKDTFKANYTKNDSFRFSLPKGFHKIDQYNEVVSLVGTIRGRLHNTFTPSISAICLAMDKTGLSQFITTNENPIVNAFTDLVQAQFSYQKLFTIEKQMQGGLDKWLTAFLNIIIDEKFDGIDFSSIFALIPSTRTVALLSATTQSWFYNETIKWMQLMAVFFEEQWNLGVNKCVINNMMVPRRGTTTIDVRGWNAAAGAWGNLKRYLMLLAPILGKPLVKITKVLKLTAADQMQWAASVDPDCKVLAIIITKGIKPWTGIITDVTDFETIITNACTENEVPVRKWLSGPIERSAEVRPDITSVCGVVVASESADTLKAIGAFGAKPWGCIDAEYINAEYINAEEY